VVAAAAAAAAAVLLLLYSCRLARYNLSLRARCRVSKTQSTNIPFFLLLVAYPPKKKNKKINTIIACTAAVTATAPQPHGQPTFKRVWSYNNNSSGRSSSCRI